MILDILTGQGKNHPSFQSITTIFPTRRYSPYPHWPALILFDRADQARSRKAARQRESEEGIYFHEGVEKDDRAIGENYVRKSDLSLRVKGKLQERRPSRRGKKSPKLKRAYKRRERRSASGQPFLPTASAHVSAFTCADLITTRPPLLCTIPVHGPENHHNIPHHRQWCHRSS